MTAIQNRPSATPDRLDKSVFSDTSDSNNVKQNTLGQIVRAGIQDPSVTTDLLAQGTNNLYVSIAEKAKLAGIQAGAQQNAVTSVNTLQGAVVLTQDQIGNGANYVQTENNFTDTAVTQLGTAYSHSQITNGNPHGTDKADVGLGNVTNDIQLSRTAGNFSSLLEKPDVQYHLNDMTVIQDSADSNAIKKVSNKTNLIWYGSYIQERGPSINYNHFVIAGSTTYRLNSLVSIGGNIYMCSVAHQSSSSFAADLAAGYWTVIGGGGAGGNTLTSGSGSPTVAGVNPGDLYVDIATGDVYYWNGLIRQPISGGGGGGGVEYTTPTTTGNKITFSFGTGANYIEETEISYDPLTQTWNWNGTVQTGITSFDSGYNASYNGSTISYDGTTISYDNAAISYDNTTVSSTNTEYNHDGDTINSTNTQYNHDGDELNFNDTNITNTGTTTITGGTYDSVTLNNVTITGTVSGAGVKVGPITRTPAGVSKTVTDALSTTNSVVNGISVVTGTPNGNYFDFDVSTPGSIVFTSKDFLGNSVSESGIVFYYTINY